MAIVTQRVWNWNQIWKELKYLYNQFSPKAKFEYDYLPLEYGIN